MLTYIGDVKMDERNCPKCGSDNIDYGSIVDVTPSILAVYYPVECLDCGYTGKEYYNLHFTEYVDDVVEGDTHG
jgi:predicted nucleic-acid-binding Zn-ribbon protein